MTEEFELIEDRLISGLGVLQIPQDEEYRAFRIYTDIVREPAPDYLNFKYNPERGNYCNIAYMHGGYVQSYSTIEFDKEEITYYPKGTEAYIATALACLFQVTFDKLDTLLTAAGSPPDPVQKTPVPIEPVTKGLTEILFSCRDSTAVQVRLYGLKEDVACAEGEPTPKKPPEIPPPLPPVPSDEGLEVSPPYDPGTSDDGNTKPFDKDALPPPLIPDYPVGENCQKLTVTITWNPTSEGNPGSLTRRIYGPLVDVYIEFFDESTSGNISSTIRMVHRGQPQFEACQPAPFVQGYGVWSIDAIGSVTVVPD